MKVTAWIERCLSVARRRRRSLFASSGLERLECRQLLAAGWSDALFVGPIYSGDWPQVSVTDPTAGSPRHAEVADQVPLGMPLPKAWESARELPDPPSGAVLHPLTAIPALNSYSTSFISLYLDFNGHFQDVWSGRQDLTTPPFSLDNDTSTFTDEELTAIEQIFWRVAEDFAPFAINVTTVEPDNLGNGMALSVAIGGRWEDWYGSSAGGVGLINSFTNPQPNVVYVFSETLEIPENIAEAASHEAGHGFGLHHQSEYDDDGKEVAEYYDGDATGAPIMGISYYSERSRWWLGTSSSASAIQDDLAELSGQQNGFGYRPDDHADSYASATTLAFVDNRATASGIVEQMDDVDVFRFDVAESDQYRIDFRAAQFGANLDVHLEIRTAAGTLIDERTAFHDDTLALGREFVAGSYQVLIHNDGTYGSLGQYTLQVTHGNDSTLPPTFPAEFAGESLSPTVARFTWVDALGETSYVLHATRKVGRKVQTFSETLPADISTYTLTGHGVLDGWRYVLEAVNAVGTVESDPTTPVDIPLTAPENVLAVRFTSSSLAIVWDAVPGAWAYLVRITTPAEPGNVLQEVFVDGTRTETVISSLQTGVEYLVTVTARNSTGDASQSPIAVQIPGLPDPNPILAPDPVQGSSPSPFEVHLTWPAVTGATLFQIQQRRGKEWITIKVVSAATQQVDVLPDGDRSRTQFRVVASNGTSAATSKAIKIRRPQAFVVT